MKIAKMFKTTLQQALSMFVVKRSYSSKEDTTPEKPKGCESELYPHNCYNGGCLYCIRFNTFKASL
jgi:hypothetical protein